MIKYKIIFAARAEKELGGLPDQIARRIIPRIDQLAENPFPPGCKKMQGAEKRWRIRIGDYRVIYEVNRNTIIVTVIHIRHRREAYD